MEQVWIVNRQHYYAGTNAVEIAYGGWDYCGSDMLKTAFSQEGEYQDPIEAVKAARQVKEQWEKSLGEPVLIAAGCTGGFLTELEAQEDGPWLDEWAQHAARNLKRCDRCGSVLGKPADRWLMPGSTDADEGLFCSQNCAELTYEDLVRTEEEEEDPNSEEYDHACLPVSA